MGRVEKLLLPLIPYKGAAPEEFSLPEATGRIYIYIHALFQMFPMDHLTTRARIYGAVQSSNRNRVDNGNVTYSILFKSYWLLLRTCVQESLEILITIRGMRIAFWFFLYESNFERFRWQSCKVWWKVSFSVTFSLRLKSEKFQSDRYHLIRYKLDCLEQIYLARRCVALQSSKPQQDLFIEVR